MFRKKGVSAVVATVSLILLTFGAVVVISTFIVPLVRDGLNEGTECTDFREYYIFVESSEYNCYLEDAPNWLYGVTVGAGSISEDDENEIKGLKLVFINSIEESNSVDVFANSPDAGNGVGQIRRVGNLPLEIPDSGESRTYVYTSDEQIEEVKVIPLLKSGRVCPESDSIRIFVECSGSLTA